jgi:hypothetical protein
MYHKSGWGKITKKAKFTIRIYYEEINVHKKKPAIGLTTYL